MKKLATLLFIIFGCIAPMMAQQEQQKPQQDPKQAGQQREHMLQRYLSRVKENVQVTEEQTPAFDAAFKKYINMLGQIHASQFGQAKPEKPTTPDEAATLINNQIITQILQLNAKKDLIESLKTTLTAEQLMKLNMSLENRGRRPGGMRQHDGQGPQGGDQQRQRRQHQGNFGGFDNEFGNFGGGFGTGEDDIN